MPILSPFTVNEFTVHDLFSFAEEVLNLDVNCIMASLDVESLFINIPLDETIENCINDLFSNNATVHNFIKEDLKKLLKFASSESFFTFDSEYYSQLDGVAIGSPLRKHQKIQNKKSGKLSEVSCESVSHDPDKVIYNFSSHKLTEEEKSVLSKDLQFALAPKRLEYAVYMLSFE